nr:MotA/TolQ/ExbB proton channel family protein [uncultured Sulfurimonas sp.]
MRRLRILKVYGILWLFIFFIVYSNLSLLYDFFITTLTFNIAVLTTLSIGLVVIFKATFELVMLTGTFAVIRYKKGGSLEFYLNGIDKIFPENVSKMFAQRASHQNIYFTHSEAAEVTNWLEEKFINQKSFIGFFVSMCLMIGLLGTFSGLLIALNDMGAIILSLQGDVNIGEVMNRLNGPIGGMSVGFGSSLFGVASAIILSLKGYILEKNQTNFIEDVQDWISSLIIESPVNAADGSVTSASGSSMSQIMEVFTDKINKFSSSMEESNKANENILKVLSQSIDGESKAAKDEMAALENISAGIKDLNISSYQSSSSLVSSIEDLSASTVNSGRSIKAMLELQEKNNELLSQLLKKLDKELKA